MDELKDKTKIELKETDSQESADTHALLPSPEALPNAMQHDKFQPTQAMVNRLRILQQGSWFGLVMCAVTTFLPHGFQANFLPIIWIALFAQTVGLASVIPATKNLKAPARTTAISLLLTLVLPVLFLYLSGQGANYLPDWLLMLNLGQKACWILPAIVMSVIPYPIATFTMVEIREGSHNKVMVTLRYMARVGVPVFFAMFPDSLIPYEMIAIPYLLSLLGLLGFFALSDVANELLVSYRERLKLEMPRDKSTPLLP